MPDDASSAADRAFAHIRSAILSGELAAGSMLSEADLGARLSMSRTPVRSALARLQDEGFITVYAKRGALVRELTAREASEAAEVRLAIESAGVRLASERRRSGLEQELAANVAGQERALADDDLPTFAALALEFHRRFVEIGENQLMLAMYDRMQDLQLLSMTRTAARIFAESTELLSEHSVMIETAVAGDWVAFSNTLAVHHECARALDSAQLRAAGATT